MDATVGQCCQPEEPALHDADGRPAVGAGFDFPAAGARPFWPLHECAGWEVIPYDDAGPRHDVPAQVWPHPCYPGGSYAGCGWAWIYECQQWGEELFLAACVCPCCAGHYWTSCGECGRDGDRSGDTNSPHPCTHRPQERWQCLE